MSTHKEELRSVDDVRAQILAACTALGDEVMPLVTACGRVLSTELHARRWLRRAGR
jgi:molybdopterin biosynthesis enzyme